MKQQRDAVAGWRRPSNRWLSHSVRGKQSIGLTQIWRDTFSAISAQDAQRGHHANSAGAVEQRPAYTAEKWVEGELGVGAFGFFVYRNALPGVSTKPLATEISGCARRLANMVHCPRGREPAGQA
jgi:hypothetical protein